VAVSEQPGVADVAALSAAQADWKALGTAAASGQLRLEPGVAEQCALACEKLRESLQDDVTTVQRIGRLKGFGDLRSGQQLAAKFEAKAQGGPSSADAVLAQHQAILVDMAATYRAAGAGFVQHEQSIADAVRAQS
jgi:hypothetical protein